MMKPLYILYSLLVLSISFSSCQKGGTASVEPERVVRQYQSFIDNNRFEAAKKVSTFKEGERLTQLEADMAKEKHDAILDTKFLNISCEEKSGIALCLCDLRDQYEDYTVLYKLVLSGNDWLIDAPDERGGKQEAQIVEELLKELYD